MLIIILLLSLGSLTLRLLRLKNGKKAPRELSWPNPDSDLIPYGIFLKEFGRFLSRTFFRFRESSAPDAHRGDRKRYVARADEKLTALLELESAVRPIAFQ